VITAGRDLYDDPRRLADAGAAHVLAVDSSQRMLAPATLIGGLLDAGLELTGIDEPVPGPAALQSHPHLAEHLRRPPLLVLGARRGHVDLTDGEK
jgi:hypothetical protein